MRSAGLLAAALSAVLTAVAGVPAVAAPSDAKASLIQTERLHLYAGAKPAASARGTTTDHTVVSAEGLPRTYRLFVPEDLTSAAPLLLALHGGLGSGQQFEASSGLNGLATSNDFIVAYPDGVARFLDGTGARTWNAGKCCGPAVTRNVDDVAFLRAVVEDVANIQRVDRSRVYATGHSNGGMMAARLACEASDVFAAVGIQSATLETAGCSPHQPVSFMHIHGTADGNIPITGGNGSGIAGVTSSPPSKAARTLSRLNDCRGKPERLRDKSNPDLILTRWKSCAPGVGVQFLSVAGAGHAWMGQPPSSPWVDELLGPPYRKFDSSRAIWSFLAAHPRV